MQEVAMHHSHVDETWTAANDPNIFYFKFIYHDVIFALNSVQRLLPLINIKHLLLLLLHYFIFYESYVYDYGLTNEITPL